jgi:hypothetical protein
MLQLLCLCTQKFSLRVPRDFPQKQKSTKQSSDYHRFSLARDIDDDVKRSHGERKDSCI